MDFLKESHGRAVEFRDKIFLQTLGIPPVVWHFSYKELTEISKLHKFWKIRTLVSSTKELCKQNEWMISFES